MAGTQLSITGWLCDSCACVGLQDLGMEKDAKSAMLRFCSLQLTSYVTRYGGTNKNEYNKLEAFYIFVAGPEESGSYHSKKWTKYGTEFAAFITENKLGTVVSPGKTKNLKHHPSTTCQTWVWMPDQPNLIKWWETNKPAPKETKVTLETFDALTAPKPTPPKKLGIWDTARGVADGTYRCPHCRKTYVQGERIWYDADGAYYCEAYGNQLLYANPV